MTGLKFMINMLILCPGSPVTPRTISEIKCFSEVLSFYLPRQLDKLANVDIMPIPETDCAELQTIFANIDVAKYTAILTLGLRFYSKISIKTTNLLRCRFDGLFCQTHDSGRLDNDPVDVTFTFRDDARTLDNTNNRLSRHNTYNECMGWAADPKLNVSNQSKTDLRILVDHTNYGPADAVDLTIDVLQQIDDFINSNTWKKKYKSVSVRRFISGAVIDVDFDNLSDLTTYTKSAKLLPITEISKEHSLAHIFCVTHPESVGLVVLETALAGAFIVTPDKFIPADRLETVRSLEWSGSINWNSVLTSIDPAASRNIAIKNNWNTVAQTIITAIEKRLKNKMVNKRKNF